MAGRKKDVVAAVPACAHFQALGEFNLKLADEVEGVLKTTAWSARNFAATLILTEDYTASPGGRRIHRKPGGSEWAP